MKETQVMKECGDVINSYVIEYERKNQRWTTKVDARDVESARHQFWRDNPDTEILSCV